VANIKAMEAKLDQLNKKHTDLRTQINYAGGKKRHSLEIQDEKVWLQICKLEQDLQYAKLEQSKRDEEKWARDQQKASRQTRSYSNSSYSSYQTSSQSSSSKTVDSIPDVIANSPQGKVKTDKNDWQEWTSIGYLTANDFRDSNSKFRECFKSGYYKAKFNNEPKKEVGPHKTDAHQWLFALENIYTGNDYPHYSMFYDTVDKSTTYNEHFTCSGERKDQIKFPNIQFTRDKTFAKSFSDMLDERIKNGNHYLSYYKPD
jgi:hypothetical protein